MMNRQVMGIALVLGIVFVAGYVFMWPPTTTDVIAEQSAADSESSGRKTALAIDALIDQKVDAAKEEMRKVIEENCITEKDTVWTDLLDTVNSCVSSDDEMWTELTENVDSLISWRPTVNSRLAEHERRIISLEKCTKCGQQAAAKKPPKGVKPSDGKTGGGSSGGAKRLGKKSKGVQPLPLITAEKVQMNADICGNPEVTTLPVFTEVLGADDPGRKLAIDFFKERHPLFELKNAVVERAVTVVQVP